MEFGLALILLIGVVAMVVLVPLVRGQARERSDDYRRAALEAAKEAKYREIRDAELDRAAGKLDEPDFTAVDAELRREAVAILRDLDAAEAELRRTRAV